MTRGIVVGLASAGVLVLGSAACHVPPRMPQQLLRDGTPVPVQVTGGHEGRAYVGVNVKDAEVVVGDVAIHVEDARSARPRDLTRPSLDDALAMIASAASNVADIAVDVNAAAKEVHDAAGNAHASRTTQRVRGSAVDRVRAQSSAIARGASKVAEGAEVIAGVAELARVLGVILGDPNDDTTLRIAADARGTPYRATCSLREKKLLEERPGISCTIVRADAPPTRVWHLNVATTEPELAAGLPPSRGWLRAEPPHPTSPRFWISRPDATVRMLGRRTRDDYTAFAVMHEGKPLASLRVRDADAPPAVWFARDRSDLDGETNDAVEIALAILALPPWTTLPSWKNPSDAS